MELDKIRNLSANELKHEEQQAAEQLFRLRFQMRLGQTEGVKKLRGLKKDVARIKTITRERELGLKVEPHHSHPDAVPAKKAAAKKAKKKVVKSKATKKVAKKTIGAKRVVKKSATKKAAKKKEAR